jgi:hypothetical protein
MAIVNGYTTLALLRTFMGAPTTPADELLEAAINAASRSIDNYCGRRFWLDGSVVTRTFAGNGSALLDLPAGIGTTTGLVVKTDTGADGLFATTWAAADYQLLPVNAPYAFPEPEPWTAIQAIGSHLFLAGTTLRPNAVQITAKWGWPAVPEAVSYACRLKAARLVSRKDSPQGVAGFGDFGPVRLTSREDSDVVLLLDPYRPVSVA